MADQKSNESISRQTERLRQMRQREERMTEAVSRTYANENQSYFDEAARLDGEAIRHLRNRGYSWTWIAQQTGRSADELRAHQALPFGRPA